MKTPKQKAIELAGIMTLEQYNELADIADIKFPEFNKEENYE